VARVALATCAAFPAGEPVDGGLLLAACRAEGLSAEYVDWAAAHVDWVGYDLVVIRSTWDYVPRRTQFLRWAAAVPSLANPASVVAWNSQKTYLADLTAQGVPCIPSWFAGPGEKVELPADGEFVIKPAEGVGSLGAGRFTEPSAAARAHAQALLDAGRTVMVQPYVSGVDGAGETGLIFLGGQYSHAIRKGAMLPPGHVHPMTLQERDELFVAEAITARSPSPAERAVADAALAAVPQSADLLYARVDLLPGADGPVVGEVELIEPSLFLEFDQSAPTRLARAIAVRARLSVG
jgi:glutathione synthase/RimK-type ligase-like ATP-grasp enzyme